MGIFDTLVDSIMVVIAGLLGILALLAGVQQAAFANQITGTALALVGLVLLVFASKL